MNSVVYKKVRFDLKTDKSSQVSPKKRFLEKVREDFYVIPRPLRESYQETNTMYA